MQFFSLIQPPASQRMKAGRVKLSPGEEVGEHKTEKREELIIILSGRAVLVRAGEREKLVAGAARYLKEGVRHNVINVGDQVLEYIYVVSLNQNNDQAI